MDERDRAAHEARPTDLPRRAAGRAARAARRAGPIWRFAATKKGDPFDGQRCVRISAHLYNSVDQYAYLAEALAAELEREHEG
jgi:selenocysteine lyase/cysteine desulfurase